MKSILLFLILLCCVSATAQRKKNQIGLRIGDPVGVNFKTFLSEKSALEFIAGTTSAQWARTYYLNSFKMEYFRHRDDVEFVSHRSSNALYLHARYLAPRLLTWEAVPGRFDWYWGVGLAAKRADIRYDYLVYYTVNEETFSVADQLDVTDYDFGPEGVLGIEYSFADIPLSIGYEFSILIEVHDRPGMFRGFTGLSVRYNW